MMESIILCGGESKRMKPYIPFNKPLVEIKSGVTLIEHQVRWLINSGMERIIIAVDRETHRTLEEGLPSLDRLEFSVEKERLGTGGAVFKAAEQVESSIFYVMNVDDILLSETYTPLNLLETLEENRHALGAILITQTRFPFGIVETSSNRVTKFKQKPLLSHKICSGHYAFAKKGVGKYFPRKGSFEDKALPRMARDNVLYSKELEGEWITINNIKELEVARRRLAEVERQRSSL